METVKKVIAVIKEKWAALSPMHQGIVIGIVGVLVLQAIL